MTQVAIPNGTHLVGDDAITRISHQNYNDPITDTWQQENIYNNPITNISSEKFIHRLRISTFARRNDKLRIWDKAETFLVRK